MAPTPEQIKLIRDFEPVLFFQGTGPAGEPAERFFPSDAKRYLEHCALWNATAPFATRADWGGSTPVVAADKLGALENEGEVYLGKGIPNGPFDFLETPADKECFLTMTGWEPAGSPFPSADRFAALNALASRYASDPALTESQFWYHAEFFDFPRLRALFDDARDTGKTNNDFLTLLEPMSGSPAVLTDPALICYYLFYPGHDEGLQGCSGVNEAKEFGSFAGEWTCIALLLNRPDQNSPYTPKFVGLTNRNIGKIQVAGREERITMRVKPWTGMKLFGDTHPGFEVGKGSHAYFVPGETPASLDPRTGADQSAGDCGLPQNVVDQLAHSDDYGVGDALVSIFVIPWLKAAAGAGAGLSLGGLAGAGLGALGGLIWGMAEGADKMNGLHIRGTPSPSPTIDTVGTSSGKVVHPKNVVPPGVDPSRLEKWRSDDNVQIGDPPRRYDSTVDRDQQILWPDDPAPNPPASGVPNPQRKGFTGRWGPRVASDMETRRTGMRFPNFWLLFFEEMVRSARPSNVQFLTAGSGTWTVPADWNNSNNTVECIGGGAGGTGSWTDNNVGGSGGGGGAYARSANLNLTPGASVTYNVGAGSAGGPSAAGGSSSASAGGDTWFNSASFPTSGQACGAKGASAHTGTSPGTGGQAAGSFSTGSGAITQDGGNGAGGGESGIGAGGGGGGAAGLGGAGNAGTSGSATAPGTGDAGNTAAGANGTRWDALHGPGGGGNGGNRSAGGDAGLYGAGGGGGGYVTSGAGSQGGKGADGLIVITYTP
jgi:glycine rich protein